MIRLFNVYYPTRILVLFLCEALLVGGSFLLAAAYLMGPDIYITLVYQGGMLKILGIVAFTLLLSYYFDLYEPQRISVRWEIYFRLLLVLSALSFFLGVLVYFFPQMDIGPYVLVAGVAVLVFLFFIWRWVYEWIIGLSIFRERVYVLGCGEQAKTIVEILRTRRDVGMEVVERGGTEAPPAQQERFAADLRAFNESKVPIDRVIVAMEDRRGSMPLRELLALRLRGVVIEDSRSVIERLSGKLSLAGLNPSSLIFTEGFNAKQSLQLGQRLISIVVAAIGLAVCLPFVPFIILTMHFCSPGPIFFRQTRVGRKGRPFSIYKFRTMRVDAEANGAVWATKNDSRITTLGRFMRKTRLD
ncbi:MAG TPA: sugar transferase, partial [Acidobacteriaceae bacterium]|nr:sugar transferase [Acidobacteriaceae bacterium]